jgi:hypothetical protein
MEVKQQLKHRKLISKDRNYKVDLVVDSSNDTIEIYIDGWFLGRLDLINLSEEIKDYIEV